MSRSYQSAARAHSGEALTFELDGVTFTCTTEISVLEFSELASYADVEASSAEGISALKVFFTTMLGPAEYRRFRRHVASQRTDDDTIVEIMGDLAEDFLGRPTKAPSRSPSTPSATGSGSTAPGSRKVVNLGTGLVQVEDLTAPPATAEPHALAELGDVELVS